MSATPLLDVQGLGVRYAGATRDALADVSFAIAAGESVALVGASGAGKSTLALALMRLLPADARARGRVLLDGEDLLAVTPDAMRDRRGRRIALVFQDTVNALHAVRTVADQFATLAAAHAADAPDVVRARALALFARMGIANPARVWEAYPFQLSGGLCQRVWMAMALYHGPALLIADEPTASLDAAAAREVLTLLDELRRERAMGLLLVTHDAQVVARHADRVVRLPAVAW